MNFATKKHAIEAQWQLTAVFDCIDEQFKNIHENCIFLVEERKSFEIFKKLRSR